ncbi:MAG: ABC transporter ATP-binding protein [Candidatus Amulumruptor caecigallinarius]|nr:ABC transporter ATP-binding protein [Candidatus Amulumruptor caecigallinarius]
MDNIVSVNNVSKSFSNHKALDNVSFDVPRGSVYGLLGPNGAGKTTLIRIINHITLPDEGIVTFNGHPLSADDVYNIGYLPEERGLYKKMKVGEQAIFFARLKGLSQREATVRLKEWFERMEISDWWDKKIEELSKGMAQKVQFIITVLHNPQLLIFDEPFSGFDPINANILKREILRLRNEGSTIIFSTHNMESVEELCDNITLINRSKNILTGSVKDVKRRFADNRFSLIYEGDAMKLLESMRNIGAGFTPESTDKLGRSTAILELPDNDRTDVRALVSAVNNAVDICSFEQLMPSFNNIFVSAVQKADKVAESFNNNNA